MQAFIRQKLHVLRLKTESTWRTYGPTRFAECAELYLRDRLARRHYHFEDIERVPELRKSDMVFVFGAGASLQEISDAEWARIAQHDTVGWRLFAHQEYVRGDFLLAREMGGMEYFDGRRARLLGCIDWAARLKENPKFADAVVVVQEGWRATSGNRLFGHRLLPEDRRYMRYHNGKRDPQAMPGQSFSEGITHGSGTLTDAVNFAYLGGWKHIVLIGVDLYDNRYFLTQKGQQNETWVGHPDSDRPNTTVFSGIVQDMAPWVKWLNARDVRISVHNPRSLMAEVMPVFSWEMPDS
jgi:hypothetical protein